VSIEIRLRYVLGVRGLAAGIAGSSGIGFRRFAAWALLSCLVWAAVTGLLGYAAGEALERILGNLRDLEAVLLVILALAAAVHALTLQRWARRRSRR